MRLSAFETYCLFLSLKTHFTQQKYDFFKYGGKTRKITLESFAARKDKMCFQRISRLHDKSHMKDFIVSNMIKGNIYPLSLITQEAEQNYQDYLKRKQSFSYLFGNELTVLFSSVETPSNVFHKINDQYPKIINDYLNESISLETICVLNEYVRFIKRLDERLGTDDIIWSKLRFLIQKYTPFLEYDKNKIKGILKNTIYT